MVRVERMQYKLDEDGRAGAKKLRSDEII